MLIVLAQGLPQWLGWWAVLAGVGQVLARAVWTEGIAFVPVTAFWVWVAVVSVLLIRGRFAGPESSADYGAAPTSVASRSSTPEKGAAR
jgi:hypothetical protein